MFHYYLHKGHSIKELEALDQVELLFMKASLEVEIEHKAEMLNSMGEG